MPKPYKPSRETIDRCEAAIRKETEAGLAVESTRIYFEEAQAELDEIRKQIGHPRGYEVVTDDDPPRPPRKKRGKKTRKKSTKKKTRTKGKRAPTKKKRPAGKGKPGASRKIIKKALMNGAVWTVPQLADRTGLPRATVMNHLGRLVDAGEIERVGRGQYQK